LILYKKSYDLHVQFFGVEHQRTLQVLNNLAATYQYLGNIKEALLRNKKTYNLALELLGENHPYTLISLNNFAAAMNAQTIPNQEMNPINLIHSNPSDYSNTNYKNNKIFTSFEKSYYGLKSKLGLNNYYTINALRNLSIIHINSGNLKLGIKHLSTIVRAVENLRKGNFSPENRQTLFKQYIPSYVSYAFAQIQVNQIDNAFHTVELTKARTLLESIALKLAIEHTNLSKKERQQFDSFHKKITTLDYRIVQTANTEQQITLRTEKNKLIQQSIAFQNKLKKRYPKFAQLADPKILTAQQGQKLIPKDTLFINYLEHNNRILVFTLDNMGNLHGYDLDESSYLDNYLTLVKDINKSPYKIALDSELLSAQLLTPIQQQLEKYPNWIISPSGKLAQIPFETLFLNDEMVIKNHQISYVQSLSTYALLKQREKDLAKQRNRKALLAMGAPYYQDPNKLPIKCKTRSTANTTTEKLLLADASVYRNALQRLGTWCTLKGTETELDELKRLFSTQKPIIYRHKNASESKLVQLNQQKQLKNYKYLHFATHGYLDNQTPALSSIVLSQVNTTDKYDGYITASEWIGYDLRSDLMVLSACDTAAGGSMSGEGIMGLTYALYVAGNKNTLMTLWSIDDTSTAEFIKRFYQKVLQGQTHIQALTETKREFIQHPKYSHPALWAAFVLYGV
ncbi:MAG: CHAT domain-containing tetratricopeptide repeat protein, partial [Thiotrichaceae bacterium]|nr:CHAT domain-containing tetratricopeptide repeat protein [Thiotrichaceae bacterium]